MLPKGREGNLAVRSLSLGGFFVSKLVKNKHKKLLVLFCMQMASVLAVF